ncbi:MAG: LLM class flavin-dependent oxidoreductase [Myxococcota bacterium]
MSDHQLACGLPPGPDFADLAALAESLGYARVWIFESPALWEDPLIHLALAAERTSRIGLATAVLIPQQRSLPAMASGLATVARLAPGRLRACFGTGFTAMVATGRTPMRLDALLDYVAALRGLLAGETVRYEGRVLRMMHSPGLATERPIDVPLWLSVFGPRGQARAAEIAEGIIGPLHPTLPTATMVSGTVLEAGEDPQSPRVREAVGPWRVVAWHGAWARGGASAVDAMPGGAVWRAALEGLAAEDERHLLAFEGHVTHLPSRDRGLLDQPQAGGAARGELTGDAASVRAGVEALWKAGFREVIYTPSGPDVARELRAFAAAATDAS